MNTEALEPREQLASRLIDAWCEAHGKQISWEKAVRITAIICQMPDEQRDRLLSYDDEDTGKPPIELNEQEARAWRLGFMAKKDGLSVCNGDFAPLPPAQPLLIAAVALKEIRQTLEAAKVGIDWYRGACPEHDSDADDEIIERIDAAIAAVRALEAAHKIGAKP